MNEFQTSRIAPVFTTRLLIPNLIEIHSVVSDVKYEVGYSCIVFRYAFLAEEDVEIFEPVIIYLFHSL